ncbi:MAG: winged helix-turn-helix domain-containing protein [Thermodesulfobacteriota bacterium]
MSVAPPAATPRNTPATPLGLTLPELAEAKKLPVDFLKGLGLADKKVQGGFRVTIPYMNAGGEVTALRYRLSLDGSQRFMWRKGDRVLPYGLWRLKEAAKKGWRLLVEGESDSWTCWYHGLPAIGIPGKTTFRPDWAELFQGLRVYLWQEPDAPELPLKLVKFLPGLMVIRAPDGFKDLSQAHIQGEDIPALVESLKAQAIPAAMLAKEAQDTRIKELREAACTILGAQDPLALVRQAILSQGFGGDVKQPLIVYIAATSRLLAMRSGAMPVHLLLVAQASAGKSYLLAVVLRFLPEEAFHVIDAGSPRVLIYDEADLQHRVLVFGEADSLPAGEDNPAASAVRNLLQEHSLKYKVTVKNPETGDYCVKEVEKPGPTVMISTSTRRLGYQLDTRVFSLPVVDTPEKIEAALLAQADLELNGAAAPDDALIAFQGYLQALAPWEVTVPFIKELAAEIGRKATATRIMRDFARLTSLIKSTAIIRQQYRQRDKEGRVIAQIEDYETVFDLVGPMYEATLTGVTKELQATVQAVGEMLDAGMSITATTLAARLGINRGTASRRVNAAIKRGWIVNRETKKGQPWDLAIGEPLPETQGLPDPEMLRACCGVALATGGATEGATVQHGETIEDNGKCCTVAVSTDGFSSPSSGDLKEMTL